MQLRPRHSSVHMSNTAAVLPGLLLPLPQELAEQAAASAAAEADARDKPTLRQRLDSAGQAGPEEELMHNPLQLHTAVSGRGWMRCGFVPSCLLNFPVSSDALLRGPFFHLLPCSHAESAAALPAPLHLTGQAFPAGRHPRSWRCCRGRGPRGQAAPGGGAVF
jgi:hypothetical protein